MNIQKTDIQNIPSKSYTSSDNNTSSDAAKQSNNTNPLTKQSASLVKNTQYKITHETDNSIISGNNNIDSSSNPSGYGWAQWKTGELQIEK